VVCGSASNSHSFFSLIYYLKQLLFSTSEPSGVLNLFYSIFLFTSYFNWRGVPRSLAWDQIRMIMFKETDMEDWVDLVVSR